VRATSVAVARRFGAPALAVALSLAVPAAADDRDSDETRADALRIAALEGLPPDADTDDESGLALPPALSAADTRRYRLIFALQEDGAWAEADREIATLEDDVLMGHVLFQRYMHPTAYRSKYLELYEWMKSYHDHPGAKRIYRLALRRQPGGYKSPVEPTFNSRRVAAVPPAAAEGYRSPRKRSAETRRAVRKEWRGINAHFRTHDAEGAERHLGGRLATLFDEVEFDRARQGVAQAYFFAGNDAKALELAAASAERSRAYAPIADWTAGLAAWRSGQYDRAFVHFAALANSESASPWNIAAGGFWGARAALVSGRPEHVARLLEAAADHRRTFYGILAARLLGEDVDFAWDQPPLSAEAREQLAARPGVRRAIALSEAGQYDLADQELRGLAPAAGEETHSVLLAIASRLNLAAAAMRLGAANGADGRVYDLAAYPVPHWHPDGGFAIDRALVFALIRQESEFNVRATSPAGARGLMQLMPRTASFIARDRGLRRGDKKKLYQPEFNMALGQRYLDHLLAEEIVAGDLFRLVIAYNGGPGNLKKWLRRTNHPEDPLLFIEAIPSRESRLFVERVMANLWLYRARLSQAAPSLDAVAAGEWPRYVALDGADRWFARAADGR
jgi:soluble lytic murein transglycosylase-like protein